IAEIRQLRTAAESVRLFYVAATRAKDRLILAGEPFRSAAGTWRGMLDAARATVPGLGERVHELRGATLAAPPMTLAAPVAAPAGGAPVEPRGCRSRARPARARNARASPARARRPRGRRRRPRRAVARRRLRSLDRGGRAGARSRPCPARHAVHARARHLRRR